MCACILSFLFPPLFSSPDPRPTVLPQAVPRLIKLSVPVSHVWLTGSELGSFLWADTEESCQLYFLFSSLFVSVLFQLSVDFTLLAGKRILPSPNFFKLNLFFYLRNSIKVMRLQIPCSSVGPVHGSKSLWHHFVVHQSE